MKKAFEGIITEMGEEGSHHINVAENIRKMVIQPFRKWTDEHKQRVDYSYGFLRSKLDSYTKDGAEAQKVQSRYFNKCRVYDIARREDDETGAQLEKDTDPTDKKDTHQTSHSNELNTNTETNEVKQDGKKETEGSTSTSTHPAESLETLSLGGIEYTNSELKQFLSKMLHEIPQREVKIPIIGKYDHVSTGSDIVDWLSKHSTNGSVAAAEQIGQDLIQNGFLRLVGQVGSKFLNSSVQKYQWKELTFVRAGLADPTPERKGSDLLSSIAGDYLPDSISNSISNYLSNPNPNETSTEKLEREVKELDSKCYDAVTKYDDSRMQLEEMMIRHFDFMQRCETDRLKAIKVVMLDFTAAISNKVVGLKSTIDKYLLYQESIVPERDLRYLVELYKTGSFAPKAPCYDNYYAPSKGWTFGGDLEVRARGDGKRIPLIVSTILRYLDNQYPSMQDDEKRLGIWTIAVPLEQTHQLRKEVNNGEPIPKEVLDKYTPPIVVSLLKLYLLELPDSLVSSKFYDHIKTIYSERPGTAKGSSFVQSESERFTNIQTILKECKISSVMTIDAIAKHLERLMEIAKPEEEYRVQLAHELEPLVLRPKQQTQATMDDRHAYLFVRDILQHRRTIFDELRRQSSTASRKSSASMKLNQSTSSNRSNRGSAVGLLSSSINNHPTAVERVQREELGDGAAGGLKALSRQTSFAEASETNDFHATPINTAASKLAHSIGSSNKRDSIEITAVKEKEPVGESTGYTGATGANAGVGASGERTLDPAAASARQNVAAPLASPIPEGAEVIEVEDD